LLFLRDELARLVWPGEVVDGTSIEIYLLKARIWTNSKCAGR